MTKEEFCKIGMVMKTYYPKEANLLKDDAAINAWYQMLKDLNYQTMCIALNRWVATERWSPTIADLRRLCYEVTAPETLTWDEAWERVMQAVTYYGHNRRIEALDTFDDLTRKAVNRVGWMQICMSEEIAVERANFRNIYTAIAERMVKEGQIAPAVRKVIHATQNSHRAIPEQKAVNTTPEPEKAPESESRDYSDKVQELIRQTKEKLKSVN